MHIIRTLTNHRLARRFRWAELWLVGMQAFLTFVCSFGPLSRQAEAIARQRLDVWARLLGCLIAIAAAKRFKPFPRRVGGAPRKAFGANLRTAIGSSLRRALRGGDGQTRAATLAAIARDPQIFVARLLRRLKRGLTRLRPHLPARATERIVRSLRAPCVVLCDTS